MERIPLVLYESPKCDTLETDSQIICSSPQFGGSYFEDYEEDDFIF